MEEIEIMQLELSTSMCTSVNLTPTIIGMDSKHAARPLLYPVSLEEDY